MEFVDEETEMANCPQDERLRDVRRSAANRAAPDERREEGRLEAGEHGVVVPEEGLAGAVTRELAMAQKRRRERRVRAALRELQQEQQSMEAERLALPHGAEKRVAHLT